MGGFNLPPGCSVSDIPGNQPNQAEALWDHLFEKFPWLDEMSNDASRRKEYDQVCDLVDYVYQTVKEVTRSTLRVVEPTELDGE